MLRVMEQPLVVVNMDKMRVPVLYPFFAYNVLLYISFILTALMKVLLEVRPLSIVVFPKLVSPIRSHFSWKFICRHSTPMAPLNLGRLQQWIDAGRLDTSRVITMKDLLDSRAVHKIQYGVKLLADVSSIITCL